MSVVQRFPEFTVKWVSLPWEAAAAYKLRQRVFCQEQGLFENDDRDNTDDHAKILVAIGGWGGWHDEVVGTVRIHQENHEGQTVWFGSRLAVDPNYRREGLLGPTLIRLAVSSACGLGCTRFLANVQKQNERLFQRLHWDTIGYKTILGVEHAFMQADLSYYPPCLDPISGFMVRTRNTVRKNFSALSILAGETILPGFIPGKQSTQVTATQLTPPKLTPMPNAMAASA